MFDLCRYKTLDAEEAEERYAQRGKIINKWAMMVNRKLKPGEEGVGEEDPDGEEAGAKKAKKKDLKISDMEEWDDEGDALDTSEDEKDDKDESGSDGEKKKRSRDTKKKKKKKKTDVDEAFEDSDDGDDEGREVDYMSDESSDSDQELEKDHDVKGVDQDEGISKMLDSDSESDEDKKKSGEESDDDEDETGKKKKKKEGGSDDDEDKKGKNKKSGSAGNSRSATPTKDVEKAERDMKRKAMVANILDPNATGESSAKKSRLEQFGSSGSSSSTAFGDITEEDVRRYLKRRPMTTTDLLKKFKSKTKKNNNELVQHLANILKKVNPHKQKSKGTVYLSLKE